MDTAQEAEAIASSLSGIVSCYKVGYQLFVATGQTFVKKLADSGCEVFFDLKLNDVDETIRLAVSNLMKQCSCVKFLTLQGGAATVRAAVAGRGASQSPMLLSVPLLSSLDQSDLAEQGLIGETARYRTIDDYLAGQAGRVIEAGSDGLIASGGAIALLRQQFPRSTGKVIVSPGIRPSGASTDEHKRSATPAGAIRDGSDYLVVGRPIRDASDRASAAREIVREIEQALAEL